MIWLKTILVNDNTNPLNSRHGLDFGVPFSLLVEG